MTCEECREQMLLLEKEDELSEAVRQHLASCTPCQNSARESETLRGHLRRLAASERAPEALRRAVEALAAGEKLQRRRPKLRLGKVAAIAFFLALGGGALWWYRSERSPSPERLAQVFITDHLEFLPGREQLVSASAPEIARWFQGRVDFPVRVPELPAAAPQDARVCLIASRKAALIHYRRKPDDVLVSLFVAEAPPALRRTQDSGLVTMAYQGCNAVLWCRRGLVYSLVAELDEASLRRLTESARQQEP